MSDSVDPLEHALHGTDHDRLRAARQIARTPAAKFREPLRRALRIETVPWAVRALEAALEATENASATQGVPTPPPVEQPVDDPETALERRQIYADALHETSEVLLHEITTVVGRAQYAAERELPEDSSLRSELTLLRNICEGMEALASATEVPHTAEVELSQAVRDLVAAETGGASPAVRTRGPSPLMAVGDQGLLNIALRNIILNAIEATQELGSTLEERPVVVSWGTDEACYWIAVIDRGPGPPPGGDLFRLGVTTKASHPGLGLTAAQQAMQSMGGEVLLNENEAGGVTVVLRWPFPEGPA